MLLLPVGILMLTGILALVVEMIAPRKLTATISWLSIIGVIASAVILCWQFSAPDTETFAGSILRDRLGTLLQLGILGSGLLIYAFSYGYLERKKLLHGEFYAIASWAISGAMVMVSTNSLLMLFIGLEVLSIGLYVLAGWSRREEKSEESAIKYFLLGAFASAFLLYGIAFIYGATGSVSLSLVAQAWGMKQANTNILLIFGFLMMFVGLAFKSGFVPFHQWAPDVYQGAPTNVTSLMAAISKLASIGALIRVLAAFQGSKEYWLPMMIVIAILTMTVANVAACLQKDVKRILGYSSIANGGYLLAAILAHFKDPDRVGLGTTIFFLFTYSLMTLGVLAVVSLQVHRGRDATLLSNLHGFWRRSPFLGALLVILSASLVGIPPTGGFFAKYAVFTDLLSSNMMPLAIALAVNSAISAYYYLGIAYHAVIVPGDSDETERPANLAVLGTCFVCAAAVLVMGTFVGPILGMLNGGSN